METTFDYLRTYASLLGSRILETFPPLQSTKDPVEPSIASLLRKALPAQALAITAPRRTFAKPIRRGSWPNAELARPTWRWAQFMCWRMGGHRICELLRDMMRFS